MGGASPTVRPQGSNAFRTRSVLFANTLHFIPIEILDPPRCLYSEFLSMTFSAILPAHLQFSPARKSEES